MIKLTECSLPTPTARLTSMRKYFRIFSAMVLMFTGETNQFVPTSQNGSMRRIPQNTLTPMIATGRARLQDQGVRLAQMRRTSSARKMEPGCVYILSWGVMVTLSVNTQKMKMSYSAVKNMFKSSWLHPLQVKYAPAECMQIWKPLRQFAMEYQNVTMLRTRIAKRPICLTSSLVQHLAGSSCFSSD